MKLDGTATTVIVNIVPGRNNMVRVTGKINSVLLLTGRHYRGISDFIAQKLDGADFVGGKTSILAIGRGTLKVIPHNPPIRGVGWVHACLAGTEEQARHCDVVGRNINVR